MKIYTQNYEAYFIQTYSDTGIWSESQILDGYNKEAKKRRSEIIDTIETRLRMDSVIGNSGNNTVKIPWRTKLLFVTYEDTDNYERVVIDLEILS